MKLDLSTYLVTDTALSGARGTEEVVRLALTGGVTVVQLRDPHAKTGEMVEQARALLRVLRPAGVPLIINDRVDVASGRGVARHAVPFQVPADRLRAENLAFELELVFPNRDLLLVVQPVSRNVPLPREDQNLDHRQPAAHRVFMHQAGGGDRAVIGVRAKNHERPSRAQDVPERFPDIDQVAMRVATTSRF